MPAPVEARGLVKRYGEIVAVDHVDLTVAAGDVYGYLGPNGAGKTTSVRMLLGLIKPNEGSVRLFGRDPLVEGARALQGVAGFVEEPRFYPYLSARKNLELLAAYDGGGARERIDSVLDIVELRDRAKDKVRGYSHGMRQRLGIAGALLRDPRLLLLDEPTTGLDPAGIRDMRDLVRRLAEQGMTIVLSSHILAEVEALCDRVGILRRGRVVFEGALSELRSAAGGTYALRTTDQRRALELCEAHAGLSGVRQDDGAVRFSAPEEAVASLSIALGDADVGILALVPHMPTLEELFFDVTESDEADRAPAGAAQAGS